MSEIREIARGVTAMVVGSGALLGLFCFEIIVEPLDAGTIRAHQYARFSIRPLQLHERTQRGAQRSLLFME